MTPNEFTGENPDTANQQQQQQQQGNFFNNKAIFLRVLTVRDD
jgi:hypothetical protein